MKYQGIIFDFDGVLIESEYAGNLHIAETLTALGYPLTVEESLARFTGLGGQDFIDALTGFVGGPVPSEFKERRRIEDARAMAEGVGAVEGAIDFVRGLPSDLPKAVASSSTTPWLHAHLAHLGLANVFGTHVYSGREHVARGKPAPDIYLFAAEQLDIDIVHTLIIEDSAVGVTGAAASGAHVVGLAAGQHCGPGHADRLRAVGAHDVATDFATISALL